MKKQRTAQAPQAAAAGPEAAGPQAAGPGNAARQEALKASVTSVPGDMEAAFGADFSNIRVRTGPEAQAHGALSFAQGNEIVFQPGLVDENSPRFRFLLGHELTHILQQRSGRAGRGGMNNDPALEAEADSLGRKAAMGQSVKVGGGGEAAKDVANAPVQRYAVQRKGRNTLRVSEDGKMAVREGYPNHHFWAEPSLIQGAEAKLKANGSVISLNEGSDTEVIKKPDGTGSVALVEVVPVNSRTKTGGDSMTHYADCGRSTRDVMGGDGEQWGTMKATYNDKNGGPRKETRAGHRPGDFKRELFDDLAGGQHNYDAMDDAGKRAFDEKAGINDFANPEVGEGFTMNSGGAPIKGYEDNTWNFHFAGLVMKSGGDFVSLENFSVSKPDVSNADWTFDMYGPAHREGQTFHDQHTATNQHGETPTTMAVKSARN